VLILKDKRQGISYSFSLFPLWIGLFILIKERMSVVSTTVYEKYVELTKQSAIEIAKENGFYPEYADLRCKEIGDGNLNYVYLLTDKETKKSLIIKQALPYAKVVGESWPLTLKRAEIEANALKKHGEFVPNLVPEVYKVDTELAITIMEDLSHLTVARTGLIAGNNYPLLASDIGEYLAKTLFYTSDFALHPFEKKKLVKEFSNPELCKISEDLVFTDPFFNAETNNIEALLMSDVELIWSNTSLKLEVAKLKKSFLTEAEALLHGDLHTGSIFVSETETKIFDPEFAFYGPIGFDIGQFIANLVFQVITREGSQREFVLKQIEETWNVFTSTFSELWDKDSVDSFAKVEGYKEYIIEKIFRDSLGFAGCELIRRTIGLALVKDLEGIEDEGERISLKKKALRIGEKLVLNRSDLTSIQAVVTLVQEEIK